MNKLDLQITNNPLIMDSQEEQSGEYKQEILIDKKKLKQIQHENFSLSSHAGFKVNTLQKMGISSRNHHLYYGLNIQERALDIDITSNKVMIPFVI